MKRSNISHHMGDATWNEIISDDVTLLTTHDLSEKIIVKNSERLCKTLILKEK